MNLENKFMIIPKEKLSVNKLILLCLKKLEIGQVLENTFQMSNSVELNFTSDLGRTRLRKSTSYIADNNEKVYILFANHNEKGKDIQQMSYSFLKSNDVNISDEHLNHYNPYIQTTKIINVTSSMTLRFESDLQKNEIVNDDKLKDKINERMWNLQFYTENFEKSFSLLCYLESMAHNNYVTYLQKISINQFAKLKKWIDVFNNNPGLPSNYNVNHVIDVLLENAKNLRDLNKHQEGLTAKTTLFSINFSETSHANICFRIKIGTFNILIDNKIGRYRYMFHPGFYLFVRFLEITDNIQHFELMLQKQLFKYI